MSNFTVHTIDSASDAARPTLQAVKDTYGFLPNLFGVFGESPAIAEAYAAVSGIFSSKTDLNPVEQQVVLLSASFVNGCDYCMAAHTGAAKAAKAGNQVIEGLRSGGPLGDAKLEALRTFTVAVVEQRGWVDDAVVNAFLAAGYTRQHVLDVILGVSLKTLSNYTNHLATTPLDAPFQPLKWTKPEAVTA
ncbi:MAG: carboxymuconolactone decarboxylase family protein [Acidobacteriota bacterium]